MPELGSGLASSKPWLGDEETTSKLVKSSASAQVQEQRRALVAVFSACERVRLAHALHFVEQEAAMLFRQLFDRESSTYSYLLADEETREAIPIDTVVEQLDRDLEQLRQLDLELRYVLDTHVHADHVTGAGRLRERTGAKTVAGRGGAPCVDIAVSHDDSIRVGKIELRVLATPGHTNDSVSYFAGDRVFTGDALLIRGAGRTDFQNGEAGVLYDSLTRILFSLPDETLVFPAHDYRGLTCSTIGEEKRFNARVAGRSREQFIELMNGLHLPEPKRIHDAVPANLACGEFVSSPQG